MNRFFFTIFGLVIFSQTGSAQPLDSLKNALQTASGTTRVDLLQKIGFSTAKKIPDSAAIVFEQSLKLASALDYGEGIVEAYSGLAYCYEFDNQKALVIDNYKKAIEAAGKYQLYNLQGNQYLHFGNYYAFTDSAILALTNYKNAIKCFKQEDNKDKLITTYMRVGNLYDNQGEYVEALKNQFRALEIIEIVNDRKSLSGVYNNIAIIYKKQHNIKDAMAYYLKSIAIAEEFDDKWGINITKVNIALIFKDENKLDTARFMLNQSLEFFEKEEDSLAQSQLLHNLGVVYLEANQLDSALYFFNRSQELAYKYGYKKTESKNYIQFAKLYRKQGKYNKAINQVNKSIDVAKAISSTENIEEALDIKYRIYEDMKEFVNAYRVLKEYQKYHDTLFNNANSKQIGLLKTSLELKEKEKEVALLEKEKEIQSLNEDKKRASNYYLISGLIALGLISLILLISRNHKSKANKLLKHQAAEIRSKKEKIETQKLKLVEKNKHLQSLNEDKNELIGMVAHDMRSPLNQIKGLINILKVTVETNNESEEVIGKIDDSTDRLRELVNRTLDLKAIESKKINLNKDVINLGELAQYVVKNLQEAAKEKSITIVDKLVKKCCLIYVDRNYTIQIIENLLCNALKFSNHHSKVEILVSREGSKARLEIRDEGPGLSEEDQKQLFKPFQQLTAKPTNKESSTGLGLAIVKRYVNAMGGEVLCESRLGQGAKFIVLFDLIDLPVSDPVPQ